MLPSAGRAKSYDAQLGIYGMGSLRTDRREDMGGKLQASG